ncbi:EamA family transporter RarD [Litorimonas haliclonae]|uniref:EamA family transporter RarD n=1 Tax=Litorimonas haliclonae TaxID=2081977 RepID=UPI0039F0AFEE
MSYQDKSPATDLARQGLLAGIAAYTMWGMFPIYFKLTQSVPPAEFVAYRILFSVPFGLLIILFRKQVDDVLVALKNPKTVLLLLFAAVALAFNWGVYIFAIQDGQIFQASLGYYINPLMYVLVGVVFFSEKLSKLQGLAALLALVGVAILTLYGGVFPIIALCLAVTFTLYGVIRKYVEIGAMPGLFIETILLMIPALFFLLYLRQAGPLQVETAAWGLKTLIFLAGPVTVLPLLAFAFSARRLKLATLGFLQYIGPTLQFMCGLYFGEVFTLAHAICFAFIWVGVAVFSYDAWDNNRRIKKVGLQ